jgi:ATP-dependent DNA ligase
VVRRDGPRVRCFTRNGHDWADRFPAIVDAALRIKAASFLIDGEAVIACDDGTPDFRALRSKRRGHEAVLYAFDLIEHDGDDHDHVHGQRRHRLHPAGTPNRYAVGDVTDVFPFGTGAHVDKLRRGLQSEHGMKACCVDGLEHGV